MPRSELYAQIKDIAGTPGVTRSGGAIGVTLARLSRDARDGHAAGLDGDATALTIVQHDHVSREFAVWLTGRADARPDWTPFPSTLEWGELMDSPAGQAACAAVSWAWERGMTLLAAAS